MNIQRTTNKYVSAILNRVPAAGKTTPKTTKGHV